MEKLFVHIYVCCTPVFINRKNATDINNKNFIEIKSLKELLEVIR